MDSPKIGDTIIFKACTRYSFKKATRIVNGFMYGNPTVRYAGYSDFMVKPSEIIQIITKEDSK